MSDNKIIYYVRLYTKQSLCAMSDNTVMLLIIYYSYLVISKDKTYFHIDSWHRNKCNTFKKKVYDQNIN